MIKKFLAAMTVSLMVTSSANAMPLSLEQSIERALTTNESISAADFGRESARWSLSSARRQFGPTLNWSSEAYRIGGRYYQNYRERHKRYGDNGTIIYSSYGYPISFQEGSTAYNNTFSNSLTLTMPFYTGGRLEGNIKNRRYAVNSADLTSENTRQTVKYRVIEAYYNVLQQENLVKVNESAVQMAAEQLNLLQVQFEEGATAYAEVLQMKVQLANYTQSLTTARSNLQVARTTLLSLVELPEDTALELTDNFSYEEYPSPLEECLEFAFTNRPDLAAANYNINQAEASVESAKSGTRPTITGRANKYTSANGAFQNERPGQWQAGITLNWNVFDNQMTRADVKAAQARVEQSKAEAESTNKTVELEVRSAYTRMRAAEENVKATEIAVTQADESYEIAVVRYVEGVDILLNVTNAQEKLTQAQTNYFTALYQYNLYKAQLEKAMGIPVAIDVPTYVSAAHENKSPDKVLKLSALE